MDLFDRGQARQALEEFRRAHVLAPNFRVLYNIGLVHARLGESVEAVRFLRRYLDEGGEAIDPERLTEVRAAIVEQGLRIGELRVEVDVVGAEVFVDGVLVGTTPLGPVSLAMGQHLISARAVERQEASTTVRLAGGQTETVTLLLPMRSEAMARVAISGGLVDVAIAVDGELRGTTPLARSLAVTPGAHVITLTRLGYGPSLSNVQLQAGEELRIDGDLEPDGSADGRLVLALPELEHTLRVDGRLVSGARLDLPPGRHLVEIQMVDRTTYRREVEVTQGRDLPVAPRLRWTPRERAMRAESRGRWIAAWSLTGVGLVTTLVGGAMTYRSGAQLRDLDADVESATNDIERRNANLRMDAFGQTHESRLFVRAGTTVVGAFITFGGIIMLSKNRTDREVDLDAHVAMGTDGASAAIRGRF